MQSRVKETVTYTWKIENFNVSQNSSIESPEISCTNEKIKFSLLRNLEPTKDFIFIKFWYGNPKVSSYFNYRVSILGKSEEKLYSKEYHWRYDNFCCYNIVNFILKNGIFEFLIDGRLTLLLEVDILEGLNNGESINNNKISPQADLSVDYQSLLESGDFSDIVCVVGDKEFKVHKNILAARSSVFKAMFSADLEEKRKNRVEIIDVDVEVFEQLLTYIYSGEIPNLKEFGLELFVASDKYHLDHLKCICEQSLGSSLNIESVSNVLVIADMHNAKKLKANCIEFITKNSAKVLTTDSWKLVKSKPDLVLAILEKMSALQS